jgi:hypothetical protein
VNEKFLTGSAPAYRDSGILAAARPSWAVSSASQDLNFLRYDVTNGFLLHNATTVGTDLSMLLPRPRSADISRGAQAGRRRHHRRARPPHCQRKHHGVRAAPRSSASPTAASS